MNSAWGAVASALAWIGVGLIVSGLMARTVAGASLQARPRIRSAGAALCGGGLLALCMALPAIAGDLFAAAGYAIAVSLLLPGFLIDNRLTRVSSHVGLIGVIGLYLRGEWLEGQLAETGIKVAAGAGIFAAAIIAARLRQKFQPTKRSRNVHA